MIVKLRWRKLSSGQRSYYLDYHYKGKRYREFLRLHVRHRDKDDRELMELAKDIQRKKINLLTSDDFDVFSVTKERSSFLSFYDRYAESYKKTDIRKVEASKLNFGKFLTEVEKRSDLQGKELTEKLCADYRNYLEDKFTGETAQSYFRVFKKVVKAANKQGFLKSNPADDISVSKQPTELTKDVLTDEELQKLANTHCGNDEIKRAFLLSCYTGLGQAECEQLQWKNIEGNLLRSRREKTDQIISIPLNDTSKKLLGNPGKPDDFIFRLPSINGTNKTIRNWVSRAGIDKRISFYCGRHTFAVRLLTHGVNLKTIANLMGQTSTKHLEKYLSRIDHLNRPAIDKLPDINL